MEIEFIHNPPLNEFDRPTTEFTLLIEIDGEEYFYSFHKFINKSYDLLLLKSFQNLEEFIIETKALLKIFDITLIYRKGTDDEIINLIKNKNP